MSMYVHLLAILSVSLLCYLLVAIFKQTYTHVMTHCNAVHCINTENQTPYCVEEHV